MQLLADRGVCGACGSGGWARGDINGLATSGTRDTWKRLRLGEDEGDTVGGLGPGERSREPPFRFTSSRAAGVGVAVAAPDAVAFPAGLAITVPVAASTNGRLWQVSDIFREPK